MIDLPEKSIENHFRDKKFHTKKNPVFMSNCYDNGCELKGNFNDYIILNGDNIVICLKRHEKSVDRIVFARKIENKKVIVLLCELTKGYKKSNEVLEKMKSSGEYIVDVLEKYGFKVVNFDCIYLGRYEDEKRIRKTNKFSIPGCSRNDLTIRQFACGIDMANIKKLNLISNEV